MLEADTCGAGASGRNGGCVLTWSTKFFTLRRLFGEAEALRLVRASEKAVTDIEAFCTEHGIECEWRRHGTLFTATSQAQLGASDAVVSALEACGIHSWQRVPLPQLQRQSGSRAHLEGWYSPQAATVQPAKLVRGLRRVALAMGVRLHEQTPMIRLQERLAAGGSHPAWQSQGAQGGHRHQCLDGPYLPANSNAAWRSFPATWSSPSPRRKGWTHAAWIAAFRCWTRAYSSTTTAARPTAG